MLRRRSTSRPYIGQTIRVYLTGTEDSIEQTSFVVDDFALNVQ